MQIIFNHKYGNQEQGEFFYSPAELINVTPEESNIALELGFLMQVVGNQTKWYQSRSTRINTELTNYEVMDNARILEAPQPFVAMDHIYTAYCYHKKFKKYFEVGSHLDIDKFMGYYQNDSLVAWAKLRPYNDIAIETVLFVWDYSDPNSRLGTKSLQHEIAWSKQQGYKYVYLGPGYERSSLYKAELQGFEWWTGAYWSTDVEEYKKLCKRDSRLKSVADLYDI